MDGYFSNFWNDLVARVTGPLSLRLFLQPTMATIFAVRDGLKDAKTAKPPYFYAIFTDPAHREAMLKDGWHAVAKVFILAMILDCIFQLIVFRWIHPAEVVLIAFLLAFNPYLLVRGLVNRIAARSFVRKSVQKLSIALLSLICLQVFWSVAMAQSAPAQPLFPK